jgi:hypothetical protein
VTRRQKLFPQSEEKQIVRRRDHSVRIAFLFNHDQIHQIAHSLPVAVALARSGQGVEVIIATTNDRIAAEVRRLLDVDGPHDITLKSLGLEAPTSRRLDAILGGMAPTGKLLVYRDNLDFFKSLDALVVTERTSLILKTRYGLSNLMMILTDHGAGDRAIGFGASTARFDHILAAGTKIRDRLVNEAGVDPKRLTITGYPKFDIAATNAKPFKFRDSDRLTVLYNPHVSPHLSSWYREGRAVLDYFLGSDRYNLIFAPHIMLFERRVVLSIDKLRFGIPGRIAAKYASAPNIHVDLGSAALTDMSYTNAADVYLGDVSSQVYEFLRTPRPCAFLNVFGVNHVGDPNYAHWQAGPVIASAKELDTALDQAITDHQARYQTIQKSLFDYTFDLTSEPSSVRAARAISQLLEIASKGKEGHDARLAV